MTRRTELFIVSAVVLIAACVTFVPLRNEWVLHTKSKTTAAKQNVAKGDRARAEIEAFNKKFVDAHLKMDNAAIMNMWAEDGVSLLPATAPMIGRPTTCRRTDIRCWFPRTRRWQRRSWAAGGASYGAIPTA